MHITNYPCTPLLDEIVDKTDAIEVRRLRGIIRRPVKTPDTKYRRKLLHDIIILENN